MSPRVAWVAVLLLACSGEEEPRPPAPSPTGDTGVEEPLIADAGEDQYVAPGAAFTLDAGPLEEGVEATWTLSDGQVLQGSPVVTTLAEPGHYSVVLELVRSETTATDSALVTAVYEKLTPAPVSSSAMFLQDGTLYAAVRHLDEVVSVDVASAGVNDRLAVCDDPRSVAWRGGKAPGLAVVCAADDRLQIHGVTGDSFVEEVTLPWGSGATALLADGDQLMVLGSRRGEGFRVAGEPAALTERFELVRDGRAMAVVPGEQVIVPRFRLGVDAEALVSRWDLGPDGLPEEFPDLLRLTNDPGPDSDTNARGLPNLLGAVSVRPDGRQVAVAGLKANIERGLVRDGEALRSDATVRADLRLLERDPPSGTLTERDTVVFDDRDRVVALAWSDRGDWLYAAHGGMELIDVIDPFTAQRAGVSTPVGGLVDDLLVDGDTLWALSSLGRVLVQYDLSDPTLPVEVARIDLTPPGGDPADPEVLEGERWFHRANDPRLNSGGYIACASCHPDGEHDGLTWDFTDRGEGLRNTLPLVGRSGMGHGPLHWSGNFDEPHDFENDIRGPQAGEGLMDDADFAATEDPLGAPKAGLSPELDALAAYMSSLSDVPRSPYRSDDGSLTVPAERGRFLFEQPKRLCLSCHPDPQYTDSAFVDDGNGGLEPILHDVGTLDDTSGERLGEGPLLGVDTPTLRGTGVTGPWGHRGQAPTVLDLFPPGDTHGITSDLSPAQLDDLEAYVLQIE